MAAALAEYGLAISVEERPSTSGGSFDSIDPARGAPWARIAEADPNDVTDAVGAAVTALEGHWGGLSPTRRAHSDAVGRSH